MIWHLPHIRALAAWSGGPVTLIAKPRSAADQIFAAEATVDAVVWADRNPEDHEGRHDGVAGLARLISVIRAGGYRRAVLLHHSRTLAFAMLAAGIPERYGYGSGPQRWFLNHGPFLPENSLRLHPYDQATAWIEAAGIALTDPEPRLPVSARARRAVIERLQGVAAPSPDSLREPALSASAAKPAGGQGGLVVLGIGSSESYKQWGARRFIELALGLADAGWRRFALAAGIAETGMAEEVRASLANRAEVIPAIAWTIPELAALAAEAAFYVGNDTGALNLAAAVGTRSYGLFGAVPPFHHATRVVAVLPPDGQASLHDGMARITPAMVLAAIRADRGSLAQMGGSDALA